MGLYVLERISSRVTTEPNEPGTKNEFEKFNKVVDESSKSRY